MCLPFFSNSPADLEEAPNLPERVHLSREKLKGCIKTFYAPIHSLQFHLCSDQCCVGSHGLPQTQPGSASHPAGAMHLQLPTPGLPCWCWVMKVHLLGSSMCNLNMQGTEVMWANMWSWEKEAKQTTLKSCPLCSLTPHKIEQLASSVSLVRMVNSRTCLCIVRENVVKIVKIQKAIVRGIRLWVSFPFPNFLRYGFTNLKMNAHTFQILKPLLALYSPGQLGFSVQCAGECHLPAH